MLFANAPGKFGQVAGHRPLVLASAGLVAAGAFVVACQHRATPSAQAEQMWVGGLAVAAPAEPQVAPLTSASLVVPKAELALPPLPPKPAVHVRAACDSADRLCVVKPLAGVAPARRPAGSASVAASSGNGQAAAGQPSLATTPVKAALIEKKAARPGLLGQLNPLSHMPDMSLISRPIAAAHGAVAGLIKWL